MRGEALGHFSPAFGDACMAWEGGGRTPGQAPQWARVFYTHRAKLPQLSNDGASIGAANPDRVWRMRYRNPSPR